MRVRLQPNGFIKSVHNEWVIIMIADLKRYDPTVIQIQNGTQIDLMDIGANIILELCHIRQPFLVRSVRMEVPVQVVSGDMCRIIR